MLLNFFFLKPLFWSGFFPVLKKRNFQSPLMKRNFLKLFSPLSHWSEQLGPNSPQDSFAPLKVSTKAQRSFRLTPWSVGLALKKSLFPLSCDLISF